MRAIAIWKRLLVVVVLCAAAAVAAPAAGAAAVRACSPVVNPYAGTRFEGSDLRRIRARGVSCRTARRVARGAHRRALGITPPISGIRRFRWNGWRVVGDLRGPSDSYLAVREGKRVRWLF